MGKARFKGYEFRNGKIAKNRLVVPPMASQTADHEGHATDATLKHYERLAQAGAGIVFVEYSFVHPTGKGEPRQLGASSWCHVDGLSRIARVIHDSGALAGLQLVHVGGKTSTELTGSFLMGPSAIAVPVKGRELESPVPMSGEQIESWIDWFVQAAQRAEQAGFDFVELHAAHGYGLNQWLSPLTNQRDDSFGGTIQERGRLLLTIAQRIKEQLPGLLLAIRLPAQDHVPGGLQADEMSWIVQRLEKLGADLIDVSSGIGGWRRPEGRDGEGYLVGDAAFLKSFISTPVIGVGGIETANFIDRAIDENRVDFAAVGRAILRDPSGWRNQVALVDSSVVSGSHFERRN